jgi:polyisoprenoid-binding protein YceI
MILRVVPARFALGLLLGLLLDMILAAAAPLHAEVTRFRIQPEASELTFHATSRLMNADGKFSRFAGDVTVDPADLKTARVTVSVEAASLDTGIARRDRHLRSEDFFQVEKFPAITFESLRVEGAGRRLLVVGRLTLRGVTREVRVPVDVSVAGNRLEARGQFDVKRTNHGMNYDSAVNPIGEQVRIAFAFRGQAP